VKRTLVNLAAAGAVTAGLIAALGRTPLGARVRARWSTVVRMERHR